MSASSEEIELLAADAFALFEEEGDVALAAFLADHPEEAGRIREALEAVAYFDEALGAENDHSTIVAEGGKPPPPMPAIGSAATDGFGRGTRVGDFVIQGELGRGGMGIVYRARQRRLQREVALKVLPPEFHANSNWTKRFVLEARSAARLSHPSIVTVFDAGSAGGICYLAMELIEGESVAQVMRRGLLLQEWAVEITRQIAGALMVLHETGLLHRDVKPANIMLAGPRAKLMDFGLVTDVHDDQSLTRSGIVLGTPAYMSPEQIRGSCPDGSGLDGRSDIYSLGVVLFEGLCGYLPHDKERTNALLAEVRTTPAPIPLRRGRRLPRDLETIVLRCLEKDPANRYQDAGQLEDDLGRFSRGEPILARRIPALVRVARRVKQNPVLSTAIAGAVVVFLVASYLLVHLDSSARIAELEQQAVAAQESVQASLAALEALRATQRQERATAAKQRGELESERAEGDRLRLLVAASEARLSDDALIGIGRARQLLESGKLAEATREYDRLIVAADGAEHALLSRFAVDVATAQAEALSRTEAAEAAAREAAAAQRSADPPVASGIGAAEQEALLAQARRMAGDRKFRAAAELLAAKAGLAPSEFGREAQVYAAAAAYLTRIEATLRSQVGQELTIRAGSSGKQRAVLVELLERDGEQFLDLKLGSGGLSFPFLRLSEEDLLEWGKSAPAGERAGFLLATGHVVEAVELTGDMDSGEPVAVFALARFAEVKLARIRRTYPDAEVTLLSTERMQIRWDFAASEDLPASWQVSPERQWSVKNGALNGRGMIEFRPPLPSDASCTIEFAAPGDVQVDMGGEPLAVIATEPGPALLRRKRSELTLDKITVLASDDLLRLRAGPDRDTSLRGVTFEMPIDEEWVACISEPRTSLARFDWARANPSDAPKGATLRDIDGEGRCLELVSKQPERPPPPERPAPPPDRGPGGPPGRGPDGRRPEGPRPQPPPADGPDEVMLTLDLARERIAFAPGARIDIEIRVVGSQRGKPTGKLSLQVPDHTLGHSSSLTQIDKGVWQTVTLSTVMLQPPVAAGEPSPSALQLELKGMGSFTVQLRSIEFSVAAE